MGHNIDRCISTILECAIHIVVRSGSWPNMLQLGLGPGNGILSFFGGICD